MPGQSGFGYNKITEPMRILFIYPYVPYPLTCGAYQRAFHLMRELAKRHEVFFFALSHSAKDRDCLHVFRDFCSKVCWAEFAHPSWASLASRILSSVPLTMSHWQDERAKLVLHRFVQRFPIDLIHIQDLAMYDYGLHLHLQPPIVLDRTRVDLAHQLHAWRFQSLSWQHRISQAENLFKLYCYERGAVQSVQHSVVCCEADAQFIRQVIHRRAPVTVIPNGVDLDFFTNGTPLRTQRSHVVLTFVGTMDYLPNVDGVTWFFEKIYPSVVKAVPNLQVQIVGPNPSPRVQRFSSLPGVTITGLVPDVRPYYSGCTIFIAPIRLGSGSRLKIVEAMALGCPVVSTTIGCEGIPVTDREHILLGDDPSTFAAQTIELAKNALLRHQVGRQGQRLIRQHFSWSSLAEKYARVYQQLAA